MEQALWGGTIIADCDQCGTQELRTSAFHLTIFDTGENCYYAFFCPGCTEEVRSPADLETVLALLNVGVSATEVAVPDEVLDPARSGPPITCDDVMDFVIGLRTHDAYYWAS